MPNSESPTSGVGALPSSRLAKDSYHLVSPWFDGLTMGGITIIVWVAIMSGPLASTAHMQRFNLQGPLLGWLLALLWYPHIVASWLPLYSARERVARFPVTALMVPAVIALATLLAIRHPTDLLVCWGKLALLWLGFHFSSQTLGLSMMYARRCGAEVTPLSRCLLGPFVYLSFLYPCIQAECGAAWETSLAAEMRLPPIGLPGWMEGVGILALGLSAIGPIAFALRFRVQQGCFPPIVVFLPIVAQFLWLTAGPLDYGARLLSFGLFHGLQYLIVAGYVHLNERSLNAADPELPRFQWREGFRYVILLLFWGIVVFKGVPLSLQLIGIPGHMAVPAVLAGLVIHHAFVDGVLWKARTPDAARLLFHGSTDATRAAA